MVENILRHSVHTLQFHVGCATVNLCYTKSCRGRGIKLHKTCLENMEIECVNIQMFSASGGLCPPDPLTRGFAPGPH